MTGRATSMTNAIAASHGLDPEVYVGLDTAAMVAFDDREDPLTVVYPDGAMRALGDVSFVLGRLRGESMERVRLVFAPELGEEIRRSLQA